MLVIEHIVGHLSFFAVGDQAHGLHEPQLVRDRGLGELKQPCDVTHAELLMGKGEADLQPGDIPQHLEDLAESHQRSIVVDRPRGLDRVAPVHKRSIGIPWCHTPQNGTIEQVFKCVKNKKRWGKKQDAVRFGGRSGPEAFPVDQIFLQALTETLANV